MKNLQQRLSILAGLITAFSLAYIGIAPIWHLALANEIQQTSQVIVVLISGILSAFTGQKILSNKNQDASTTSLKAEAANNQKLAAAGYFKGLATVKDIAKNVPADAAAKHAAFEAKGGQGAIYSVPIGTYDQFRNAVIGKGYDIDGEYGDQCWDGAALLWQQLGMFLSTAGTGAAKGCWQARVQDAGSNFDLITNPSDLKRGDVIVFGEGTYGHIAFLDAINSDGTINILGENQTGSGNGAPFNVIRFTLSAFLGAFRLKSWNVSVVQPTAPVAPANAPSTSIGNTPVIGDHVTTTDTVDQNGVRLNMGIINDGQSVFTEINGKGNAVLTKDGIVRCGVTLGSLKKV